MMRPGATVPAVVLAVAWLTSTAVVAGPTAAPRWNAAAAAQYLDARMESWWANAKALKTGDGEARCLSCHTAVPYALAQPALRRLAGEAQPTAHERRIADTARVRVGVADRKQPYYDNSEDKIRESRGVESVLNALVLASWDADRQAARPSPATVGALSQLWAAQRPDGAWDWLDFGLEPYEASDATFHGAAVAAIAVGTASHLGEVSPDTTHSAGVARLRQYLASHAPSQRLFNQAWLLLAAARLDGVLAAGQSAAIVAALEARQRPDGGWSLSDLGAWRWGAAHEPFAPPGSPDKALVAAADGYATGLVVHALRQAGVPPTAPSVANGRAWLSGHEQAGVATDPAWAPWRAHSLNHDREHGGPRGEPWRRMFMSDLATAFAVLALAD